MNKFEKLSIFCLIFSLLAILTMVHDSHASQNRGIYNQCVQETKTRTRVSYRTNHKAAQQCYNQVMEILHQKRVDESYIEVNEAISDYLRDRTNPRYRRNKK